MLEKKITQKKFEIHRIYIKDISFEAPNTPKIFEKECSPDIQFNINTNYKKFKLNIFEIILQVQVTVKNKKELIFLCDVHQSGIFLIDNFNDQEFQHCISAYCPSILFPYARTCISSLVSYGSFPQLNLAPINFDHIFNENFNLNKNHINIK